MVENRELDLSKYEQVYPYFGEFQEDYFGALTYGVCSERLKDFEILQTRFRGQTEEIEKLKNDLMELSHKQQLKGMEEWKPYIYFISDDISELAFYDFNKPWSDDEGWNKNANSILINLINKYDLLKVAVLTEKDSGVIDPRDNSHHLVAWYSPSGCAQNMNLKLVKVCDRNSWANEWAGTSPGRNMMNIYTWDIKTTCSSIRYPSARGKEKGRTVSFKSGVQFKPKTICYAYPFILEWEKEDYLVRYNYKEYQKKIGKETSEIQRIYTEFLWEAHDLGHLGAPVDDDERLKYVNTIKLLEPAWNYDCRNQLEITNQFKQDAQNGDAAAQYNLGICYHAGRGVERDYKQAALWYKKAADQGITEAMHMLEVCNWEIQSGIE